MANPSENGGDWRLITGDAGIGAAAAPADGPANMAIDQALLTSVAAGAAPVLRLYRWSPATLSFGRNQPARGLYDEAAAAARGIAFVRRPTGGQAVLHDDELTYAVVAPVSVLGRPRAAYRRINEAIVAALRELGLTAAVAAGSPARGGGGAGGGGSWTDACFRRPGRGEVVAAGRKLVGSAQRTESHTILQHGSILVGGSQAAAEELLVAGSVAGSGAGAGGRAEWSPGWTTAAAELGRRPSPGALESAVVAAFESAVGTALARSGLLAGEVAAARELRGRFASPEWTWRR